MRRALIAFAAAGASLAIAGCPNPNAIGVQKYGTILTTAVDGNTGKPVAGAIVNAGSTITCTTAADGTCTLQPVPIGKWTVVANAAGLHGSADVTVAENQQTTVTVQMNP